MAQGKEARREIFGWVQPLSWFRLKFDLFGGEIEKGVFFCGFPHEGVGFACQLDRMLVGLYRHEWNINKYQKVRSKNSNLPMGVREGCPLQQMERPVSQVSDHFWHVLYPWAGGGFEFWCAPGNTGWTKVTVDKVFKLKNTMKIFGRILILEILFLLKFVFNHFLALFAMCQVFLHMPFVELNKFHLCCLKKKCHQWSMFSSRHVFFVVSGHFWPFPKFLYCNFEWNKFPKNFKWNTNAFFSFFGFIFKSFWALFPLNPGEFAAWLEVADWGENLVWPLGSGALWLKEPPFGLTSPPGTPLPAHSKSTST